MGMARRRGDTVTFAGGVFLFTFYDYIFLFMPGNVRGTFRVALAMIVRHFIGIHKPIIG